MMFDMLKNMRKICFVLLAAFVVLFAAGCKETPKAELKYGKYFSSEEAVDLSDVIEIYEKAERAEKDGVHYDALSALLGKNPNAYHYTQVFKDNSSMIRLPQYAKSNHPFLSKAEIFYNSCRYTFDIWTDYELWLVEYNDNDFVAVDGDVTECISNISEGCIGDGAVRAAARGYKADLLKLMSDMPEDIDEAYAQGHEALEAIVTSLNDAVAYQFYANEEMFVDSLDSMATEMRGITKGIYEEYVKTDSLKRNKMMLKALNDCDTFDEQCSLLLNWADSKLSWYDDEWIEPVAFRLISSGKYNPCLNDIWIMWRSMFQTVYCGSSQTSCIPNDYYNKLRKKCYTTCLKRIASYPDDIFAMNCAASIGGRCNLERFGKYPFGNQAAADEIEILPARYGR